MHRDPPPGEANWKASDVDSGEWRDSTRRIRFEVPPPQQPKEPQSDGASLFGSHFIVTPAIVIINAVVFVLMILSGVDFVRPTAQSVLDWGANYGPKTMAGEWWRLATCMFLHFGILHVGLNMFVLWGLGRLVERLVGSVGFLVVYFLSGVLASVASLVWSPVVVAAGASGAVFGVAGTLLGFLALRRDTVPGPVLRNVRNNLIFFVGINIVFGLTVPGVDLVAHMGGFVGGCVCGLVLSQPISPKMFRGRTTRNAILTVAGSGAVLTAIALLPAAPLDINQELDRFGEMESEVLETYSELVQRQQQNKIDDMEFADTVATDVLAPWDAALARIEQLAQEQHANRKYLLRLANYMKLRAECWQLLIDGTRDQDDAKLQRFAEKWEEANNLARDDEEQ